MNQIIEKIKEIVCSGELEKIKENEETISDQKKTNEQLQALFDSANKLKEEAEKNTNKMRVDLEETQKIIDRLIETPVDVWCKANNIKPVKKYYKDKIAIGDKLISCDLRELITPNSYLVQKARESLKQDADLLAWYKKVMNFVSNKIKYRSEAQDNYFYPNYTLTMKEGDCEDFTFLQCSIEPELANAYGFINPEGTDRWVGHSFGVGVLEDNLLHIFDAVTNKSGIYANMEWYKINYIITKNQVWELDGSIEFGDVLW